MYRVDMIYLKRIESSCLALYKWLVQIATDLVHPLRAVSLEFGGQMTYLRRQAQI
jgi:hypothetical protein